MFAEFVLPAVGVLDEFLGGRKVIITVKRGDVDKATISSCNIRGVKVGVDFKSSVIIEVNVGG